MSSLPARPFLIGVAGGTSSGKTTVAERLAELAGERHLALIKLDSYYVDLGDQPLEEREGATTTIPTRSTGSCSTTTSPRSPPARPSRCRSTTTPSTTAAAEVRVVRPARIVVVEGILVLYEPSLRERFDLKVYVDTDADLRLIRRLHRDVAERGRTARASSTSTWPPCGRPTSSSSSRASATPT